MPTLQEVGEALVQACREGREAELLETRYAEDAVSVEAMEMPSSGSAVTAGREGIAAKHAWWNENFETHSTRVDGPFLHGDDRFGVIFEADATERATGHRFQMREIAVYHVRDGKIVREEFMVAPQPG